ncbi:hypothetical protein OPKNFCMD_1312 [Methylobacterium crusticola]|uniref:Uncharacterized protein n=1 Tax=Methylobacterium crusticola TaxID=1697972 RepID=A0ABQ4QV68_9HYPH|nr:hypothetical protein [Methylobacterium crusticola]GJD48589.1 hypothetical protein OPKNFCMD_1312 [Methylobacterium crusticola]
MTAIAILVEPEVVLIASDGAACEPRTFRLTQAASQVLLCPEWSCVLAARGAGWAAAAAVKRRAQLANIASFDALIAGSGPLARAAEDDLARTHHEPSLGLSLLLAGWSDDRQRMELYVIRTRAPAGRPMPGDDGRAARLPNLVLVPSPTDAAAALVGLELFTGQMQFDMGNPAEYLQRVIAAARFSGRGTPDEPCTVGCFIQVTQLQRNSAHTMITHRWNDRIGEPMQPFREMTVPAFMVRRDA